MIPRHFAAVEANNCLETSAELKFLMTQSRDRVIIFDTPMRDGEQSPGASMSLQEKLELAKILEEMRVDVIEAGFPIASNGDFELLFKSHRSARRLLAVAQGGVENEDAFAIGGIAAVGTLIGHCLDPASSLVSAGSRVP